MLYRITEEDEATITDNCTKFEQAIFDSVILPILKFLSLQSSSAKEYATVFQGKLNDLNSHPTLRVFDCLSLSFHLMIDCTRGNSIRHTEAASTYSKRSIFEKGVNELSCAISHLAAPGTPFQHSFSAQFSHLE